MYACKYINIFINTFILFCSPPIRHHIGGHNDAVVIHQQQGLKSTQFQPPKAENFFITNTQEEHHNPLKVKVWQAGYEYMSCNTLATMCCVCIYSRRRRRRRNAYVTNITLNCDSNNLSVNKNIVCPAKNVTKHHISIQ